MADATMVKIPEPGLPDMHVAQIAEEITRDLRRELGSMQQSVNYGEEISYGDMVALCRGVQSIARRLEHETIQKIGHVHQWNESDYCDVCGLDGRS